MYAAPPTLPTAFTAERNALSVIILAEQLFSDCVAQWSRIQLSEGARSNPGEVILLNFRHFFFPFSVLIIFSVSLVPFKADPLKL